MENRQNTTINLEVAAKWTYDFFNELELRNDLTAKVVPLSKIKEILGYDKKHNLTRHLKKFEIGYDYQSSEVRTVAGGSKRKDYYLTIDCAKELLFILNRPEASAYRKLIIKIERELRQKDFKNRLELARKQDQIDKLEAKVSQLEFDKITVTYQFDLLKTEHQELVNKTSNYIRFKQFIANPWFICEGEKVQSCVRYAVPNTQVKTLHAPVFYKTLKQNYVEGIDYAVQKVSKYKAIKPVDLHLTPLCAYETIRDTRTKLGLSQRHIKAYFPEIQAHLFGYDKEYVQLNHNSKLLQHD